MYDLIKKIFIHIIFQLKFIMILQNINYKILIHI